MTLLRRSTNTKRLSLAITVLLILLASLFFRLPSFYLPHNHGDQLQYLSLAMKLDNFGFQGYNLRGVNLFKSKDGYFVGAFPAPEGSPGNFLKGLPRYYDEPLFHKPPLFIYALMISHRLFASDRPYAAVNVNLGPRIQFRQAKVLLTTQFYCVIVPILFSLLLITATFFFGKILFSNTVGIYAAILLSISPIELLSSQRIWTDDMLAFFITAAFILYYLSRQKQNFVLASLAGICAGLAILTKPSGNIVIFIILAYELYRFWKDRVFNKMFVAFFIACILVSLPWHWQVLKIYGSLFYLPVLTQPELMNQPWFKFVFNRPWYMYLVNIPVQTPLLFFVYIAIFGIFKRCPNDEARAYRDKKVFLFIWIAMFLISFLIVKVGRELRYMLPAYPAITILSAEVLGTIQKKLNGKFGHRIGNLIVIVMIVLCGWWSVSIGWEHVFKNLAVIKRPL